MNPLCHCPEFGPLEASFLLLPQLGSPQGPDRYRTLTDPLPCPLLLPLARSSSWIAITQEGIGFLDILLEINAHFPVKAVSTITERNHILFKVHYVGWLRTALCPKLTSGAKLLRPQQQTFISKLCLSDASQLPRRTCYFTASPAPHCCLRYGSVKLLPSKEFYDFNGGFIFFTKLFGDIACASLPCTHNLQQ